MLSPGREGESRRSTRPPAGEREYEPVHPSGVCCHAGRSTREGSDGAGARRRKGAAGPEGEGAPRDQVGLGQAAGPPSVAAGCQGPFVHAAATGSVRSGKEGDGYLSLGLRLNHSVLRELLRVLPAEPRGAVAERLVAVTPSNEFVDAWCRMLRLVRTPEAIPALGPVYEREILYRVLSGPDGARLRLCGFEGGSSVRVHESIQTIRERYSETIDVRLLAADSGMSWTTFHRQFKRVTGLSPIQYQKELRLLEARKILVYEGLS
ncbi:MAG: AraC family transcriptional regulator, partial [Candidatus Eisenbacteria bacterium]|nr:AraC family transcriptional regulator [Candidatus Eisenbacteria bacterium]